VEVKEYYNDLFNPEKFLIFKSLNWCFQQCCVSIVSLAQKVRGMETMRGQKRHDNFTKRHDNFTKRPLAHRDSYQDAPEG
jgi:hypothetical protein